VDTSLRYFRDNEYEERKLAYLIAGNPKRRNVNLKLPRSYLHESGQEGHINVFSTVPLKLCITRIIVAESVLLCLTIQCPFLVFLSYYYRIYIAEIVQSA